MNPRRLDWLRALGPSPTTSAAASFVSCSASPTLSHSLSPTSPSRLRVGRGVEMQAQPAAPLQGPSQRPPLPQPHLDDRVDGKGQESLGLVEDAEDREGHEGFLGVQGVLLGHQSMDGEHNQRHLGEKRGVT